MAGKVFLVGAGPGEREFITLKGLRLLRQCDVVVYDRLVNPELLEETKEDCEKIYVGKRAGHHSMRQEDISLLLADRARQGKMVVRLKGGDPFVFGRGGEEAEYLAGEQIPFWIVPGLTSAVAVPECVGIPVTHRQVSRSFHVITAHSMEDGAEGEQSYLEKQIKSLRDAEGTFVFLMGYASLSLICRLFIKYGRSPYLPVAVIENGTRGKERVVRGTLETMGELARQAEVVAPVVIVVGETAAFSLRMPKEKKETHTGLAGVRVGVTGTSLFAKKLSQKIREEGGEAFYVQELVVKACEDQKKCFSCIFDKTWIAFTSGNGVRLFFEQMKELEMDIRLLSQKKFAVIGKGTGQALKEYGIFPDYMPKTYTTEALGKGLADLLDSRDRLLLYQAREGDRKLAETIERAGVKVERFEAYQIREKDLCLTEETDSLDYLCFGSCSGVRAFMSRKPDFFQDPACGKIKVAAIGQKTAAELRRAGCRELLTASYEDVEGIVAAIAAQRRELYDKSDAQTAKQ